MAAIRSGFSSVMMDGSLEADGKTVASYEYNVATTKKIVELAHAIGVSVEGELGVLGSLETMKGDKEDGHGAEGTMTREQLLTDVEQAADFVRQTQCDALAIAIGTSHGAYKFTKKPTGDILAIDRIAEIHARIPNTHLVMHGSSSVPKDLQDIINQYGGQMKPTWGVPVEEIQRGIRHGVRKINIDTDNRMAMTGAIRKILTENPSEFDPRKYLAPAMAAGATVVLKPAPETPLYQIGFTASAINVDEGEYTLEAMPVSGQDWLGGISIQLDQDGNIRYCEPNASGGRSCRLP